MNSEKKKRKLKGTDIALIIVAIVDIIFVGFMIWLFYLYQSVPDSLIVAVFGVTFGECGFCTLVYKIKKGVIVKEKPVTLGDITGFDDAEVIENGIHGTDVLPETEANGNQGHAGIEDLGVLDSSAGVHRVKQRKFRLNK